MYDKSQEGKQERAYECWARVADEKVVRFNVDAGKVEQVKIGGAGLSPLDIQKAFCVLLDLGVDQIDIPKALIEKNGVDVSAFSRETFPKMDTCFRRIGFKRSMILLSLFRMACLCMKTDPKKRCTLLTGKRCGVV